MEWNVSLDKENMENAEKEKRKSFKSRVQKRPNFYTNCNEIYGLCIFAAGCESFLIQFIKKLLFTQTFAFTKLFCFKTWNFSMKILVIKFYHFHSPLALHDLFFIPRTVHTHMWKISSSLYYILETISVHILLRKLFSHGNKPKARMKARKVEEIWIYCTHSLHSNRGKGGEREGGRAS